MKGSGEAVENVMLPVISFSMIDLVVGQWWSGEVYQEGRTDLYRLDNSTLIAFMPDLLSDKLTQLSVPTFICQWMPSLQKLFSNITTANTPPRWQLICCWRWLSGQVCLQTWTLLSTCGASSSGRWRSTMCLTSSSSVMSLWRGCQQQPVQLWWIPCPGGWRRCLITMVPQQNINTLYKVLTCSHVQNSFLLPVI